MARGRRRRTCRGPAVTAHGLTCSAAPTRWASLSPSYDAPAVRQQADVWKPWQVPEVRHRHVNAKVIAQRIAYIPPHSKKRKHRTPPRHLQSCSCRHEDIRSDPLSDTTPRSRHRSCEPMSIGASVGQSFSIGWENLQLTRHAHGQTTATGRGLSGDPSENTRANRPDGSEMPESVSGGRLKWLAVRALGPKRTGLNKRPRSRRPQRPSYRWIKSLNALRLGPLEGWAIGWREAPKVLQAWR